jgi:hypothetical protein
MLGIVALALMLLALPLILAEENVTCQISENATACLISSPPVESNNSIIEEELEMNESVSSGTILGQQLKIWFTFNQESKLEQQMKLARLRLIQANIAAKNNNSIAMEKALEAHERIMNKINESISKLEGKIDLKGLNNSAVKLIALERAIQVHELRVEHLQYVLSNSNLTDQQREILENKLEKAQNNTNHLVEISENKKDNIKTKLMAVGNLTEEQAELIMEQKQEKVEQQIQQRIERQKELVEERMEQRQQARERMRENKNISDDSDEVEFEDSNETEYEDSEEIEFEDSNQTESKDSNETESK